MLKKNKKLELEIIDLSDQAFGVAKLDGFTVFVESALIGELVLVKIIKVEKKYAIAIIEEIIKASDSRLEIKDPLGTITGTMPLQHMTYNAQLEFKESMVKNYFKQEFEKEDYTFLKIKGMKNPWQYRNKAQIPVREINSQLETGFFRRRSHQLIPVENFHIQDPRIDSSILIVRDLLRKHQIKAYDEEKHSGVIRNIIVRQAQHQVDQMIVLVTNTHQSLPDDLIEEIVKEIPSIVSIVQNINTKMTNVILGEEQIVLYGKDSYEDKIFHLKFKISSKSFFQVNSNQTEVLYQTALDFADVQENDVVVDAYSGIGTISLMMAEKAKHVYGVEIVRDAVIMARENAKMNKINNVSFVEDKAEDFIRKYVKENPLDVLLVDPPRKGLHQDFIESIIESKVEKFVYVSCNPKTLVRDLSLLKDHYKLKKVQCVDMFPQTLHIETIALLQKKII